MKTVGRVLIMMGLVASFLLPSAPVVSASAPPKAQAHFQTEGQGGMYKGKDKSGQKGKGGNNSCMSKKHKNSPKCVAWKLAQR